MQKELFIIRHKKLIIIITAILLLFSVIPLLNTRINSDLMSYFPSDMEEVVNNKKVEEVFGMADPVMIVIENNDILNDSTLRSIKALSKAFNRISDFDMVMSLFDTKNIKGEYGSMVVEPAVKRIPKSKNSIEKLRKEIMENELAYNFIVSKNFKYSLIILNATGKKEDAKLMDIIYKTLEEHAGNEKIYINGQPFLRAEAQDKIAKDFMFLLPLGLFIMCLFLWFSFKEKRGVLLPTMVVMFSIVVAMALIPFFGWDLSVIGILIPVMMIAIANDYGIHFIAKYQELNAKHPEMTLKQIISTAYLFLKKPVILTGLTTIFGIVGLATHVMLPAKQMGIVSAIAIAFALLASLTLIPALMLFMKKGKPHHSFTSDGKKGPIDKILQAIATFLTKNPRQVIYIFASLLIVFGLGISKLRIASDFDGILSEDHQYNVSMDIINKNFAGTKNISLLFKGDIKALDLLKRMLNYENKIEAMPNIGSVNSIASMIKIMSRALNEPNDPWYDTIPDTRNAVAQYLELYAMSGDPEDLEDFVDYDYKQAAIQIQYIAPNIEAANQTIHNIKQLVKNDTNFVVMGGMGPIENKLANAIATGQVNSLIFAFVAIALLLMIIFRSLSAGLIGSFPLLFAVVSTFGIMGWVGIELDIITALLSSISIGLGVDYTIHIFWRIKNELQQGPNFTKAIITSLTTTGRGITINAFSVIVGFSVLFLSGFPIIHLFAFLIILSIILCLISSLILIPALCQVLEPTFLSKSSIK